MLKQNLLLIIQEVAYGQQIDATLSKELVGLPNGQGFKTKKNGMIVYLKMNVWLQKMAKEVTESS